MVYKILAAARTAFLAYLLFYTIKNTPILIGLPDDINEPLRLCKAGYDAVSRAVWIGIAWLTFETAIGWFLATRKPAPAAPAAPPAPPSGSR